MVLQNRYVLAFQRVSKIAAILTIVVAGLVLLGWWLDIGALKTVLPGLTSMKPNTAVAFLAAGAALWLLHTDTTDRRVWFVRRVCMVLLIVIGALTLSEYAFGWNLGIDQLLFPGASAEGAGFPERMAPVAAVSLCLLGAALLFLDRAQPRYRISQLLALVVGVLALLALIGYLYDVDSLYHFSSYTSLALHTAIVLLVMAVGILGVRADHGWMKILISDDAGAVLARRLLPAAILVPIVLGWLGLRGDNLGLFDVDFGIAILIIAIIITFSGLIAASAVSLYRIDSARRQAEKNLRRLYDELEERVAERTAELTLANQKLETQIAERQHIEAELRQSRERFGILFRNSPTGIVLARLSDGMYLDVNESFLRATGFARDEVLGNTGTELGMIEAETRAHNIAQIRAEGALHDAEITFRIKSGELRQFLFSVEQVEVDGEMCSLSTVYDITERKRAEQESQRLNLVLDRMAEGAQLIGFDWRYLYLNDAAALQGRHSKDELVGHTMMEMYPGIETTPMFNILRRCMNERVSDHMENEFTFPDNTLGWFDLSIQPMQEGIFILTTDITKRKRVEAALRESRERFVKAFNSSPAALTITRSVDSVFVDVNENFLNLFGYSRAQVIGHASTEFAINPNPEARAELWRTMQAEGSVHNREMQLYTRSGQARNMLMSVDPLELDGEAHILTTMLDITSRKQVEAALQDSEAKLRALFQVLPMGVSILDRERHVMDMNPALEQILKIPEQDLVEGEYPRQRYIHADGSTIEPHEFPSIRAFEEQRAVLDVEMGIIREGGDTIWTNVSAVPVQVSNLGVLVVTTDITERKRTEATLAQERDLLQALMDNLPDTIYFKDTASRFTRINRAQARVLGVDKVEDAIGKTDADFQAPQLASEFYAEEQHLLQTGEPVIARQELNPTPDGQSRWFSTTKVPMVNPEGRVLGLIGVSRDITERILSEEAVIRVNAQLTERMREISFLNEMGEQLQTCVTVQEVYQVTAQWASRLFPTPSGALYVINNSRNWVETAIAWGTPPPQTPAFGLQDCWALRRGRTHISGAGYTNLPCHHVKDARPAFSICVPLLATSETFGILHLRAASDVSVRPWNEAQQQLARVVTDSVALALANLNLRETLRQQSIRDPLTELYNRRYMEESLERELLRAGRSLRTVGIVMLDVDHFKQINDSQGHNVGDAVLRQLGQFLSECTRGGDIACRYGGEEFTLILPESTLEQTRLRAEQLRQDFKAKLLKHGERVLAPVTVSLGVAGFPEHGTTGEQLLRAADIALYRAKHEGRDRVAVAE